MFHKQPLASGKDYCTNGDKNSDPENRGHPQLSLTQLAVAASKIRIVRPGMEKNEITTKISGKTTKTTERRNGSHSS